MKIITREILERWADTTFSKSELPRLISKLVRATTPNDTKIDFPSGTATYMGGWDGTVFCSEETEHVPKGTSLWELGTGKNPKNKAETDYEKRKANPLNYDPTESVFIFVTPRIWAKKHEWVQKKKEENFWKDVIVYDSIDLEQWLELTYPVSRWFAAQSGVNVLPPDGVMIADEFWEEWSIGPKGLNLQPQILLAGRENEVDLLQNTLQGEAAIIGIKASTKNEAIAFIIASAKEFDKNSSENFFSKTLIVDTTDNYRNISKSFHHSLNLIPRFDDAQPLYNAVRLGHHVLVPLGGDDDFNQNPIILPTLDRDGLIAGLIDSGVSREDAERFSKESGRNITFLKRLLGFPAFNKPEWLDPNIIHEIIPALLLGRWNEDFEGDIELIEKLSQQSYTDYLVTLNKWKNFEESPLIQIGNTWRLISPLDLWANVASYVSANDFENIKASIQLAFDKDQYTIIANDNLPSYFSNKEKKHSRWCREGLIQSLILIGRLDSAPIANLNSPQRWVDDIIDDLLFDVDGDMWISVNYELPLIAEASPDSFIKAVSHSLKKENPEIMDMFVEEEDPFGKSSNHTGLLWALEGLAWLPEYLYDASLILLQLARLDPGGSIVNRPLNSLAEIFKPWHYQTLASFDDRMEILKHITEKEKDAGWSLLIKLLPDPHGYAQPTHKMRWRIFDKSTSIAYNHQEIKETHSIILDMLLNVFNKSESQFSQLIKKTPKLSPEDRDKALSWAETVCTDIVKDEFTAWKTIRDILSHHRSYPDTDWSLPETDLIRLEAIYNNLEPENIIDKYLWLFNEYHPAFPEGFQDNEETAIDKYKSKKTKAEMARIEAIEAIIEVEGLQGVLELRKLVAEPILLGTSLTNVVTDEEDILIVSECLNDEKETIKFIHGFFFQKHSDLGLEWIISTLKDLQSKGFNDQALANIIIPLPQSSKLWGFVSTLDDNIQNEYWLNFTPTYLDISNDEKIMCVERLIDYKRFFTAIKVAYYFNDVIPTQLLTNILKNAGTKEASEAFSLDRHDLGEIFKELYTRKDVDQRILAALEWLYINQLQSYGPESFTKNIEKELATDPAFFIDLLKLVYRRDTPDDTATEETLDEAKQLKAKMAFHLLSHWRQLPGMSDDKSIDSDTLSKWVNNARQQAKEVDRLKIADVVIGNLLAQYPDDPELKSEREKIYQLMEDINSQKINSNYSSGMFNKQGITVRGAFAGGAIERERASFYEGLERETKYKFPNVSKIFKDLKNMYLEMALKEDERAERDELEY